MRRAPRARRRRLPRSAAAAPRAAARSRQECGSLRHAAESSPALSPGTLSACKGGGSPPLPRSHALATLTACLGAGSAPATTASRQPRATTRLQRRGRGRDGNAHRAADAHGSSRGSAAGRWPASSSSATTGSRARRSGTSRHELQQAACTRGEPLLIALDQEGGIVKRLAWAPPTEAPADMQNPTDAHAQAAGAAQALRESGVDIDFAPVVDTPSSPRNFLGSRAFSRSPNVERGDGEGVRPRPPAERRRGDSEALPGPRPRRAETPTTARSLINAAKWKIEQGLLPFQSGDQGRRQARDGQHRDLPAPRSVARTGGVLGDDHQRDPPSAARLHGRDGHRLAHGARSGRDPARGDEGDARRLRPPHLGQRDRRRAGLRDARRRRAGLRTRSRRGSRRQPAGSARSRRGSPRTAARAAARGPGARASRRRGATSAAP